jgi:hypothetical protein
MKKTGKIQRLLEQMARIERMERGTLCRMGGRPYHNHQTWQKGRNVVRYVPAQEVDSLQEAIDGYNQFMKLAQCYADEVIKKTRKQRRKMFRRPQGKPTKRTQKHEKRSATRNPPLDAHLDA